MKLNPIAGCFGKLPVSPEFVRYQASGSAFMEMDRWLQAGIVHLKTQMNHKQTIENSEATCWSFVFAPEGIDEFLVGIGIPSYDAAGRAFPMLCFLRVLRKEFHARIQFAPVVFSSFLHEARLQLTDCFNNPNAENFIGFLRNWALGESDPSQKIEQLYKVYMDTQTNGRYWEEVLEDRKDSMEKYKTRMMWKLNLILAPFRNGEATKPSKMKWGIKFPIHQSENTNTFDIPFWVDCTLEMMQQKGECHFLFWNRCPVEGHGYLLAFLQQPSPKVYSVLLRPQEQSELVWKLAPSQPDVDVPLSTTFQELFNNKDMSMSKFLKTVASVN